MTGVIQDGSQFLIAGYLLTWVVVAAYGISLYIRLRRFS